MPNAHTQEQIWARDDQWMKHAVTVTRAPMPGCHICKDYPTSHGVDDKAGILECVRTRQRLKIEDWG